MIFRMGVVPAYAWNLTHHECTGVLFPFLGTLGEDIREKACLMTARHRETSTGHRSTADAIQLKTYLVVATVIAAACQGICFRELPSVTALRCHLAYFPEKARQNAFHATARARAHD